MNVEQWQQETEEKVLEYKALLESGDLTQQDFDELVEGLLLSGEALDALGTEDLKNKAVKAIDAIKVVAGLL